MSDHFNTCPVFPWLKELAVPTWMGVGLGPKVSLYLLGREKSLALLGIIP
jgi:hypothetical protein